MIGILRGYGILALGVASLLAGVILAPQVPVADFGWTAYLPLDVTTAPRFIFPAAWLVLLLFAVGLVLTAGWVGFRLGCRRRA